MTPSGHRKRPGMIRALAANSTLPLLSRIACFFLFFGSFLLFSYNSGYGYDALEYLTIGKYLTQGVEWYAVIPSKSFLIYAVAAGWSLAFGISHFSVAVLITLIASAIVGSVYYVSRQLYGRQSALAASALTAVCCFFMEMNYFETEGFVAICGLWAFYFLNRQKFWIAGLWLGLSISFKVIGLFYCLGIGAWWFFQLFRGVKISTFLKETGWLLLGFFLPVLASLGYFAWIGRLEEHLHWTYIYPFGGYPAHTVFLTRFLLKLSWFILISVGILLAGLIQYKKLIQPRSPLLLAFLMLLISLFPLLKTQASHYVIPSAVFIAIALAALWKDTNEVRLVQLSRKLVAPLLLTFSLAVVGIFLYRPDAVRRLIELKDYSLEESYADWLNTLIPPDKKGLFLNRNSMYLYLFTKSTPAVPFITTEMQTTDYLQKHPETLERALDNPSLRVVVVDNPRLIFLDSVAASKAPLNRTLAAFDQKLRKEFIPLDCEDIYDVTVWLRKNDQADLPINCSRNIHEITCSYPYRQRKETP
jgi:hypothetical protein